MKRFSRIMIMLLAGLLCWSAGAIPPRSFEQADQQRQYEQLLTELRCLVCQNETLAESEAPLADDLRREVAEMVREGRGNAEIRDFLVARYGDFVLYRPPVKPLTYVLWFGPFALLGVGAVIWLVFSRRRGRAASPMLSEVDHRRARALLDGDEESQP